MSVTDRVASLTPAQRALFEKMREKQAKAARVHRPPPIQRVSGPGGVGDWPLSLDQERFWFMEQLEPHGAGLNIGAASRMRGALSVPVVAAALDEIVHRHAAWRTTFPVLAEGPVQRVVPARRQLLAVIDLSGLPAARREAEALRRVDEDVATPFDLERGPLVRVSLLQLDAEDRICLLTVHHLVVDFLSFQIVWTEMSALCAALAAGRRPELPAPPAHYPDFAVWQREWLQGEVLADLAAWWREALSGFPLALELPTDRPRPGMMRMRGGRRLVSLPPALAELLRALARGEGATVFMAVLAFLAALLHRQSGQERLILGANNANRNRPEIEPVLGTFITQIPFAIDLTGDPPFRELLARVRRSALGAYAHQDLPFGKLVEAVHPERDTSRAPVIQALVQVLDAALGKAGVPTEFTFEPVDAYDGKARFDLMLSLFDGADGLLGSLEYDADLFDPATVERLCELLGLQIAAATADPSLLLSALPVLAPAARHQALSEWNDTAVPFPGWTVPERFAARAARTPEALAVTTAGVAGEALTFAALDRQAEELAGKLRALGVEPESRVALLLGRTVDVPVALLAVWKAGGACVPLDPASPPERLAALLADAEPGVLIHRGPLRFETPSGLQSLDLGESTPRQEEGQAGALLHPEHLAYMIYTSGTTGLPKAVMVEHGSLAAVLAAAADRFAFAPGDRMPHLARFSFDISLFELFAPLLGGGACEILGEEEVLEPASLLAAVERATRLHAVPSLMRQIAAAARAAGPERFAGLRTLFTGGDLVPPDLLADLLEVFPAAEVVVLYGPTEGTIVCTHHPVPRGFRPERLLIGRPFANAEMRVIDRWGEAPLGVPGELWIGGSGVARGYFRREELTAERFVERDGRRWYRTGDLVRHLADGTLEFLGRTDLQVKIRGFRIEPGELEAQLAAHPGVREAAVVALAAPQGEKRLVAYWVAAGGADAPSPASLRAFLAGRLPAYMVPSAFVLLAELPLTAHGKLDRRRLPAPELVVETGEEAPLTPTEELIAGIWSGILGVPQVPRSANFFELGGHSLLATQVVSRLRAATGAEVTLREMFEAPTVAGLAAAVAAALSAGASSLAAPPIRRVSRGGDLPLSFAQERLWFLDRLAVGNGGYHIPFALAAHGDLSPPGMAAALGAMVERHEALRTTYSAQGERPVQIIAPPGSCALPLVDLAGLPEALRRAEARRLADSEVVRPFDLERDSVLRASIHRLGPREHVLLLVVHHIAADGWSLGLMLKEIVALYSALYSGSSEALPELPVQYADFAVWQREWLQGEVLERQLAYWRERLAGVPVLDLPTDRPRPPEQSFRGATRTHAIDAETTRALEALARRYDATLFMLLLAAMQTLLGRYTGQDDVAVGSPIAGRNRAEIEPLIGFFVNTLVLRGDLGGDPRFGELVGRSRRAALEAYSHQDVPFERLVAELRPERQLSHNPLFQVLFAVQNAPLGEVGLPGLTFSPAPFDLPATRFDLEVFFTEVAGELAVQLTYGTDLFDPVTIARLEGHLGALMASVLADPTRRLSELTILAPPERHQLLVGWNDTAAELPGEDLAALFVEQARRRPEAVAISSDEGELTYAELDRRSSRLARRLAAAGVGPEVRVALLARRSPALIVGLLAILKAGGAYVPLDPSSPAERLAWMLADSGSRLLLGHPELLANAPAGTETVELRADPPEIPGPDPRGASADGLAYVMYTSGSTGRPKGVGVTHRNVVRLVRESGFADLGPEQVFLQLTAVTFDPSTLEIWASLLNGGRLAVFPPRPPSLADLGEAITRFGVTSLWLTAGLFHQMVDGPLEALRPLRQLLAGGDVLSPPHVRRVLAALPGLTLIDGYGPTEATTFISCFSMTAPEQAGEPVSIGRPIGNTRIHMLGADLRPVPTGVWGELFTGGGGLSRGYLGRPDLTAERFVPDPFSDAGERLYRTGDIARFRPDGRIDFRGRRDGQVKLRGFRIELGEIESALGRHRDVREAAVAARDDGGAIGLRLVAYVAPHQPVARDLLVRELRRGLEAELPDYMVPSTFVVLDALPLMSNGKVDRAALPAPEVEAALTGVWVSPANPLEELLARAAAELLGRERVGMRDNFFALGGHSLLATQLVSRLTREHGIAVTLKMVFDAVDLGDLAARVGEPRLARADSQPDRVPRRPAGLQPLPLSFAQERLWFIDRLQPGLTTYNIPLALSIEGEISPAVFAAVIGEVVRRHEVLRTTFRETGGQPVQVIAAASGWALPLVDLSVLPAGVRAAQARRLAEEEAGRPFDLERGPLLRAALLRLAPAEHALLLDMHHVISDGWSMGVLVREITAIYGAVAAGEPSPLPALPIQYADFAVWQRGWLTGGVLDGQLSYWRQQLAGAPTSLPLPLDRPRPAAPSHHGREVSLPLSHVLSGRLLQVARRQEATLYMIFLAALQALLSRLTGETDIPVGSPIANRNRSEIEPLIGFFVNTLVLRADLGGGPTFDGLLAQARRTTLEAFVHQDIPFEQVVEDLQPQRHLGINPLFQVMYALQNAPRGSLSLPGLAVSGLDFEMATASFDLELNVWEEGDSLRGAFKYSTDLFDAATVRRLAGHLEILLGEVTANGDVPLSELPLLSPGERHQLAIEWNDIRPRREPLGAVERFRAQVAASPDALALEAGGESLGYAELDRRSDRLARRLRRLGVGPGVAVGLFAERSAELVAGLLGIWKAGGAFLPLDPGLPLARLAWMLEDSQVAVVAIGAGLEGSLPPHEERVLALDDRDPEDPSEELDPPQPGDLAYLVYTSGTTGRPKAVQVEHRQLASTLAAVQEAFGFAPGDRMPCIASFSFDIFLFELLGPLLAGGTCVLLPLRPTLDLERLVDELGAATRLHAVPAVMRQVLEAVWRRGAAAPRLRSLFTGGDAVPADLLADLRETFPRAGIQVLYGPTETAIVCTCWRVPAAGPVRSLLGRPFAGAEIHLRDANGVPVPVGVPGEIWIGGAGVARGYWRREELTAEKYVESAGGRFFRSGDLARRLADGTLEFLGRADQQVKVRGFRIELGEVEAALLRQGEVEAAVVTAQELLPGAGRQLVAYVVARPEEADEEAAAVRLAQWRTLYDATHGASLAVDPSFDTQGWNSSYTGQPIPVEEMHEWVERTVGRILALRPRRVLEIGCGTGLLLFRVAPHCEVYRATDFSRAVLDGVRRRLEETGDLPQVELAQAAADDWNAIPPQGFDLVILNSVVQYFPDLSYLLRVLEGAARAVRPGGYLFVGDVRNLELLEELHTAVELFHDPAAEGSPELRRRVRRRVMSEKELLLAPAFFPALARSLPSVLGAEILLKEGRYANELNRFRYDAVLEIGAAEPGGLVGQEPLRGYANTPIRGRLAASLVPRLRRALQAELPDYMVPASFVILDALPLTRHGKVDREALPAPEPPSAEAEAGDPPRTPAEEAMAALWRETLGVDQIGRDADFFTLGGHSLLATQLVSRVRDAFGVEVPLRALFETPTVAGLAVWIEGSRFSSGMPPLVPRPAGEPAPLSFGQERLWFLDRLEPGNTAFNMGSSLRLRGCLRPWALERALNEIVSRHESLRVTFGEVGGRPVQRTATSLRVPLPVIDLAALPEAVREIEADRLARASLAAPFDLEAGPLIRASLSRLGPDHHLFVLEIHHIVSDGWSAGVMDRELIALYGAFAAGRPSPLAPLAVQYGDFARWQREWLTGDALEAQLAYWRGKLGGRPAPLDLPTDRPRPALQTFRGAALSLAVPEGVGGALQAFSRERGATLFMTLLAAFKALLSRLAGQDDVVVGSPVAGRRHLETEGLIGFFLNTLALRTDLSGNPTFSELLARVRETTLGSYEHQDIPFEALLAELKPERDLSRTPLFQVFFNMLNLPREQVRLTGLEIGLGPAPEPESKFDLTLYASEAMGVIHFNLVYNADLFDEPRMAELFRQYRAVLEAAARDPGCRLEDVSLLTPEAAAFLPDLSRALAAGWPGSVHERFLARARRHPERRAVTDAAGEWTWGDLDAASGRLAARLLAAGLGPAEPVAVWAHRAAPLAAVLLGVLRAGGAFVILDPAYPPTRLAGAVSWVRPRIWVEVPGAPLLPAEVESALGGALRLRVDGPGLPVDPEAPCVAVHPDAPAWIAFTSGSTGEPKGIVGAHRPLSHFLDWHERTFGLGEDDRFSLLSGLAHDPLLRDVFTPLWVGGELRVPAPELMGEPGWLAAWFAEEGITVTHLTPAMTRLLTAGETVPLDALRLICSGGDVLTGGDVERLLRFAPWAMQVNFYGATETPQAMGWKIVETPVTRVALGRGIDGVDLLVLGASGRPAGIGELGEISIRTPYLAQGYLDDPAGTAERFAPAPGTRLYRTGDLGRYEPDGDVVYAGRADRQIKIRGFRVEPAEIERATGRLEGVREVVVAAFEEEGERALAAYVVLSPGAAPGLAARLRPLLAAHLPSALIPAVFVELSALPLTPNGKIDRRALPAPRGEVLETGTAPRNPLEEVLAGLWADLLRRERVGVRDNFFDLGGHSLLATQLVSRVRTALGVELSLRQLFDNPTLERLATVVSAQNADSLAGVAITPRPPGLAPVPASFAQERLWFLDRMQPGLAAYNIPQALRISGEVSPALLAAVLAEVVRRHEVLRTRFGEVGGHPIQVIAPAGGWTLPLVDLAALPAEIQATQTRRLAQEEAGRPFDLARGPLLRATLLRFAPAEHALLLDMHHVISDGWSMGVLVREITALYGAAIAGAPSPLSELPIQYADFAVWQREWLRGEVLARQLAYWRETLAGVPPSLELPADRPAPAERTFAGGRLRAPFGAGFTRDLSALARHCGATPFMVLLSGFQALLGRLAGTEDLTVGSPIANRNRAEIEPLIGFFVNTLVLRGDLSGDPTFRDLIARARRSTLDAYAHQDLPFEHLVEELKPERQLAVNPLFQVLFAVQNAPAGALELPGLSLAPLELVSRAAHLDLELSFWELPDGLEAELAYSTERFDPATARRLARHLETLLRGLVADADRRISEVPLTAEAERQQVVREWNDTGRAFAAPALLHDFVARQAELEPEAIAVEHAEGGLTYRELWGRSLRVSGLLRSLGVGPDVPVGIWTGRSPVLPVAVLAILEAGGACLPLDPTYPAERLALMIANACPRLFVAEEAALAGVPAGLLDGLDVVVLDAAGEAAAPRGPALEPEAVLRADPENLAYVLYTSGSTGVPKGVALPHRALVNLVAWAGEARPARGRRVLQFSPLSFDVVFEELFTTWATGGTLVLMPDELRRDAAALLPFLAEKRIERLFQPFVALQQLAEVARETGERPPALREIVTAGEQLRVTPAVAALCHGDVRLFNEYGPTETHVATAFPLRGEPGGWPALPPIGRPIANHRVLVLDPGRLPVPPGLAGEVCIGGAGLARGYFRRPDLTADRFIPDPSRTEPGARLYRTGDLARWTAGGDLEVLGRTDFQVKIRGYRVEPGEVEVAVAAHPGVRDVAVVARQDPPLGPRLVAYVVWEDEETTEAGLREALLARLPAAMVPAAFVGLAALPLTPSGKVDRRALAGPTFVPRGGGVPSGYVEPETGTERVIAAIWSEVLGVERVGARDDFFELGGHSLLATQLVSRVRGALGLELPLRVIFEAPTLAGMASWIERARSAPGLPAGAPPLLPALHTGAPPLSFAQERLWFLDRLRPEDPAYNMPTALRANGELPPALLEAILGEVVRRHEALRTTFQLREGKPVQVIAPPGAWSLPLVDLGALPAPSRLDEARRLAGEEAMRPFDLQRGPLLRAALLRLEPAGQVLLLTLHHIVSDGWSMGVLVREIAALYRAAVAGEPSPLAELPIQYADFAVWQRLWLTGDELERQLGYWREQLAGSPASLTLPFDRPRPAMPSHRGGRVSVVLDGDLRRGLGRLARRHEATLFMVLLASVQALLGRLTGQEDIPVGSSIANRNRAEIEPLIGFFVNSLVLRGDLAGDPPFRELLARTQSATLAAYAHQDLPFEQLVEALRPQRTLAMNPLFQVMLTLQNTPAKAVELPGLSLSPLDFEKDSSRFDLELAAWELEDALALDFGYSAELFDRPTLERAALSLETLLREVLAGEDRPLSGLPLLPAAARHQIVTEWNDTRPAREPRLAIERFAAQAAATPNALALEAGGERLTYGELDRRAGRLANRLRRLGVGPDVVVGLFAERSAAMVAGILGIWKAGGAYLPLDPGQPAERLAWLLEDSRVPVIATGPELAQALPPHEARIAWLDDRPGETLDETPDEPLASGPGAGDLAAMIYTSGTTGRPKAVLVEHGNLASTLAAIQEVFAFGPEDRVPSVASFAFDVFLMELLGPLLAGGTCVLLPTRPTLDLEQVVGELGSATVLITVPAVMRQVLALALLRGARAPRLRALFLGGEAVPEDLLGDLRQAFPGVEIRVCYGPTETAIVVTHWRLPDAGPARSLLGRPLAGAEILLCDAGGRPVPIGVAGEIWIGGAVVARGYWRREELTAERFVAFDGRRFYRSGDLARRLADGALEFLGRLDHQVKIRGFRIELGEIEAALLDVPGIREAVAVACGDGQGGELRLVAYLVLGPEAPSLAALRATLGRRLPVYMVPVAFVLLDALPLDTSGKIDRRALPAPEPTGAEAPRPSVPPRTPLERFLATQFREVLGLPAEREIGVDDDFFGLGGTSITGAIFVYRLQEALAETVHVVTIFDQPTVASLAEHLRERHAGACERLLEGGAPGAAPARSVLVPLQAGEPGTRPLFCVHPVGGEVVAYRELARHLGTDLPVYGLQSPDPPLADLRELAELYVAAIREAQAAGPYRLAGWSMGGVVAYEMARQLQTLGERAEIVVLIDTFSPALQAGEPEPGEVELVASFAADLARLQGLAIPEVDLSGLDAEGALALFLDLGRQAGLLPPAVELPELRRLFDRFRANRLALARYHPAPYAGVVRVFRAADGVSRIGEDPTLGWAGPAGEGLRVSDLPGDHYSILRDEVATLAGQLRALLD